MDNQCKIPSTSTSTNTESYSTINKDVVKETLEKINSDNPNRSSLDNTYENMETDSSDYVETVEEALIHVVTDSPEGISILNRNSNIRLIAVDADSPMLQIDNKIFHFNEWRYIPGTAMFFEQTKEVKPIDPLYDNRCGTVLKYIGSTRKCLEMNKKETNM